MLLSLIFSVDLGVVIDAFSIRSTRCQCRCFSRGRCGHPTRTTTRKTASCSLSFVKQHLKASKDDDLGHIDQQGSNNNSVNGVKPSTDLKPLYDGTGYTFPDTSTPSGLAEVLECTFVNACMQLSSGYVDVLKLFIAGCIACYERRFTLTVMNDALNSCPVQTANRRLMDEEVNLRSQWLSVVYMTLESMGYRNNDDDGKPATNEEATEQSLTSSLSASIATDVRVKYTPYISIVGDMYKKMVMQEDGSGSTPSSLLLSLSVEDLMKRQQQQQQQQIEESSSPVPTPKVDMTPFEEAIFLQSLRVVTLTPVVVIESMEASASSSSSVASTKTTNGTNSGAVMPPTPPIPGAFE